MNLDEAYLLHVNDLYRYLFSLSKDHHTAEDLVQESFYRAYIQLEDSELENIKSWLFKVAYHAFIDYQRKQKRIVITDEFLESQKVNHQTPEKEVLDKLGFQMLLGHIHSLPDKEKHVLILCDMHQLTYQEAADILDLKLNTLKSHLLRGRKKVVALVKERMSVDER